MKRNSHLPLVILGGLLVVAGCATPPPLTRRTVDEAFLRIRAECPPAFAATSHAFGNAAPDAAAPRLSVQQLMVDLRRVLAEIPEDESEVLFDSVPQGLRYFSGVPDDDRRYLRNGILTSHAFVRDALIDDYSYAGLERYVLAMHRLASAQADPAIDSASFHGRGDSEALVNPGGVRIWHRYEPAHLYGELAGILRDPTTETPITIASVYLPYETGDGQERGTSFSFYVADGSRLLGFDVLDTEGLAHESIPSSSPSTIAAPFHAMSRGFSWFVDHTLQAPVPGLDVPIAYPLNLACYSAVQISIATKETAFEVVKAPLAGLASNISSDRGLDRMAQSTAQPLRNAGDVWAYHTAQIRDRNGRPSVFESFLELLGGTPFLGGYRPVFFDDPWTQFGGFPATGGPAATSLPAGDASGTEHLHLFLTRGIHGRGEEEQGNEAWRIYMLSLVAEDKALRTSFGVEADADLAVTVHDLPYAWGTAFDPIFGMMNLSNGYSYAMERGAERALAAYPGERHVVALLGHSGGVQRMTMASRLMWYRGIATETLYGVAGPSIAHAPTKPGQNVVILSKSEFQDADLTSQFSAAVSMLEASFLAVYELPAVGFLWHLSSWSRSFPVSHMNAQITRREGGQSTLHRNPGTSVPKRRDLSLSFFRDDVFSILLEPWFLRNAAAELERSRGEGDER